MKIRSKKLFSALELLIVMAIMAILATMLFVVSKGVKDGAKTIQTQSTIQTAKSSVENLYNYIFNESRYKSMEVYQHPLFSKVWPSNKVWAFRDKDETDRGIKSNGLINMISIGTLGVENKSIIIDKMNFPDGVKAVDTLVDGWGFPILLMRNELAWHVKNVLPNESVTEKVYQDRTKTTVGLYARHRFITTGTGLNLYEWNDSSFNHVDSITKLTEPSYEVAPLGTDDYRLVRISGKIAVPYNNNDFDFFSPGKDGKIGNLIENDMRQDRWSGVDNEAFVSWVPTSASKVDPDMDNIITFNKYFLGTK